MIRLDERREKRGVAVGKVELARFVRARRLALEMTQEEVASASGGVFSRTWVTSVERSTREKPEREKLEVLAVVLKADPVEMLRLAGYRTGIKRVTEERTAMALARELVATLHQQPLSIPISRPISAGGGAPLEAEYVSYFPPPGKRNHEYRAFEVVGTCLEPRIMKGHAVTVDCDEEAREEARIGDIVAITADGGANLKIVSRRNGQLWLTVLQGEGDIPWTDDVEIVGRVVQVSWFP